MDKTVNGGITLIITVHNNGIALITEPKMAVLSKN